ncbi:flagellar hook-basal body complex protein FliE [Oleidesulfovibrio alaskensis]|uniref:flagellar hook-basal body complex protein FliE n=1 Tax=Oleidesulfovibrio alaskensis TaxID=58180 RepID=UPI00041F51DD|nr:flagellar hook-basal body complex protein FliE [Oleidesulfovibrio alaskensis]
MTIQSIGLKAYSNALSNFTKAERSIQSGKLTPEPRVERSFSDTINSSVKKVNDMQSEKSTMIQSFASGETQNVHELMITLQKASVAVKMTSAVRNKVMEAYRELSKMQF